MYFSRFNIDRTRLLVESLVLSTHYSRRPGDVQLVSPECEILLPAIVDRPGRSIAQGL